MNRTPFLESPALLGFEHTRGLIERASQAQDAYPPFNVEDLGGGAVRIVLAVAGFAADQIEITVQGRELTIAGRREAEPGAERVFLHRGIAARNFIRVFVLADGLDVQRAVLDHGLLHIETARPKEDAVRRVPIQRGQATDAENRRSGSGIGE